MSATMWLIIAIVGFSVSGIALIAAILMFIKMNIPAIIGDLSGKTVAREIKAMREANVFSGEKLHRPSSVNANRGKLTEKVKGTEYDNAICGQVNISKRIDITDNGQLGYFKNAETQAQIAESVSVQRTTESPSANVGEVDIEQQRTLADCERENATDVLAGNNKTAILKENQETAILSDTRQTEILCEVHQTDILCEDNDLSQRIGETSVLSVKENIEQSELKIGLFEITRSVIKIHTDEVI